MESDVLSLPHGVIWKSCALASITGTDTTDRSRLCLRSFCHRNPSRESDRERWLTRSEAARLLWASRRTQHLARFILLGIYTGSRSSVILGLTWDQIDIGAGVMYRRPAGKAEDKRKRAPPGEARPSHPDAPATLATS
jgi:integrase